MPYYLVSLRGSNFLLSFDGHTQKMGFHTARLVEASDAQQAESKALDAFRESTKYQELFSAALNGNDDRPRISVDEARQVEQSLGDRVPGLSFYRE